MARRSLGAKRANPIVTATAFLSNVSDARQTLEIDPTSVDVAENPDLGLRVKEEQVAGAKPIFEGRVVRMIVGVLAVFALSGAMIACGGDEQPQPRQFGGDDDASPEEPQLPGEVASEVKLAFRKNRFEVEVSSDRLYCLDAREGGIFEKPRRGKAQRVASFKTDDTGVDSLKVKKAGGTYFARLEPSEFAKYGQVSVCSGAQSNNARV
jgi:hypothetical protein